MSDLHPRPAAPANKNLMKIVWLVVAATGATLVAAIFAHMAVDAGVSRAVARAGGGYAGMAPPNQDQWEMTSWWVAGGAGFFIAAITLGFGKRPGWFAGLFGIVIGAAAGLAFAYYQGFTWMPGAS